MDWAGASGGCNCGAIRYVVSGAPLTGYICHCHLCQKRTGSAFSFSLVFPSQAVAITKGELRIETRERPDGDVSRAASCPACHSRLWLERGQWGSRNLRAGTLDASEDDRPVAQMWTSSAQRWALVPDILTFETQPDDFAPILAAGRAAYGGGERQ
jgi:hypothetical protein